MTPKDAADALRPTFHLLQMPADDRHRVKFVEAVAAELGVEPTPFNLYQVGAALAEAKIEHDPIEYPKMLSNMFMMSVNRDYDDRFGNEGAKIGAQLRVRIPNDYSVTDDERGLA